MNLILHTPNTNTALPQCYQRAFKKAAELFIVTAYLTEWDTTLVLNGDCRSFRIIIGKDFGITRKAACEAVMRWLPPKRKGQFMVADRIDGFHPKAVFWREPSGSCFAIVGSSNLTRAAFETNYEANIFSCISSAEFASAKRWVRSIEKQAVVISEDWLANYKETSVSLKAGRSKVRKPQESSASVITLKLPTPLGIKKQLEFRRTQLTAYRKHSAGLISLFRNCATREIDSRRFYEQLPDHWSYDLGDRLQGAGWERLGKDSDFEALSNSYLRILDSAQEDRDDTVAEEIDSLHEQGVGTRRAFLSEMLCLQFPSEFPVLNKPVKDYLAAVKFRAPRGASEGARYIDLAKKLRFALLQNPDHPAQNLAELDTVIWKVYGKK
jgi:HKD family nuclease